MPLFRAKVHEIIELDVIATDIEVESGTVRFFPDFELAVDASIEVPIDSAIEIL